MRPIAFAIFSLGVFALTAFVFKETRDLESFILLALLIVGKLFIGTTDTESDDEDDS